MRPTSAYELGNVEPLRPVRVLLSSPDRRFLAAAAFVLTRRRFVVEATESPDSLVARVEEEGVDVVVLDATGSWADAARSASAVEGQHPRTRVLLVGDDLPQSAQPVRALPKWSALESLGDAVLRTYARSPR